LAQHCPFGQCIAIGDATWSTRFFEGIVSIKRAAASYAQMTLVFTTLGMPEQVI
jgi:hypothetical protein